MSGRKAGADKSCWGLRGESDTLPVILTTCPSTFQKGLLPGAVKLTVRVSLL